MSKKFTYEVSQYSTEQFVRLAYFCTEKGDCSLNEIPSEQTQAFQDLLNKRGSEGWEFVQTFFGSDGVIIVWKKGQ